MIARDYFYHGRVHSKDAMSQSYSGYRYFSGVIRTTSFFPWSATKVMNQIISTNIEGTDNVRNDVELMSLYRVK